MQVRCQSCNKVFKPAQEESYMGMEEQDAFISKLGKTHCFGCAFWLYYADKPHPNRLIIQHNDTDRCHYISSPFEKGSGHGGARIRYRLNGYVQETRDLWAQGEIPHHLWSLFPVNTTIILE